MITGANTGIGLAAATELARRGFSLVLACRSVARGSAARDAVVAASGNPDVTVHELDLADLGATARSAHRLLALDRPIHLLVNNAGVAGTRGITNDGFELAFGVNHLGHFLFTTELLERLESSAPARIVNLSSSNHHKLRRLDLDGVRGRTDTLIGIRAYNRSKLCNVLFTLELARRYPPERVAAFAVHPGLVKSDIWRHVPAPAAGVYKRVKRMWTVEQGAASTVHCATAQGIEPISGSYVDEFCHVQRPNPLATPANAELLWRRSEEWVAPFRSG